MKAWIIRNVKRAAMLVLLALVVVLGVATKDRWLPAVENFIAKASQQAATAGGDHGDEGHAGHGHAGHDDAESLKLSPQARRNIGLKVGQVALRPFERTVAIPAMVVERPGRSQLAITAPLTGIVTKIYAIEGEAITLGQRLFEVRLTHEELVTAQRDFLRSAEELDVENREIARLEKIGEGVIAGRRLLERQYEKQKLEAVLRAAQRQGLLLHSLTPEQVDGILKTRNLLHTFIVSAPNERDEDEHQDIDHPFHVQMLAVKPGQQVAAGEPLCVLGDHCELYIEGKAFEQDADKLGQAIREEWQIDAALIGEGGQEDVDRELKILYLSDRIDPVTRAFHFYLSLPNDLVRNTTSGRHRFIGWKFKPGQRMEVLIPVERWEERIVLPTAAVVEEDAETFVFQQNGDHFERVSVHVEHRDQSWVVVANDGSIFPGDTVAVSGAFQMHLALKNKSGGGVDPHAGHTH